MARKNSMSCRIIKFTRMCCYCPKKKQVQIYTIGMLEKCNKCISLVQLSLQEMNLKRPSARFSILATIFQFREFPLIPQES